VSDQTKPVCTPMTDAEVDRIWSAFSALNVRNFLPPGFPVIVTLCGSTRFKGAWYAEGKRLTHEGKIVLSVGDLDTSAANRTVNVPLDPALKERLDELHKRKIDLSDEVLILNVKTWVCSACGKACETQPFEVHPPRSACCAAPAPMTPYIGSSTRSELEHARKRGKVVRFLNPEA
jgi:hypothetical protein